MSSTRYAPADALLRQERYASSAEYEIGLNGCLVAKRCELLERPEDRELVWFLQAASHAEGGLKRFVVEFIRRYADRVGTKSMERFGCRPGQVYKAQQVAEVRNDFDWDFWIARGFACGFPLRGEVADCDGNIAIETKGVKGRGLNSDAPEHPTSYPAADFREVCLCAAERELEDLLTEFCLDPGAKGDALRPGWWNSLEDCLREHLETHRKEKQGGVVVTELGGQVREALDYAMAGQCLVLIDGLARTGKTFAAKAWCDERPGLARYVQVPSNNDRKGFFRAIARALGVGINLQRKAQEFQERVEDTLQNSKLMLVLDEAHFLFPNVNLRAAMPERLQWVMTALVNYGVPVALVTTPQFFRTQRTVENNTCWTSEQFVGRIAHYEKLPDSLSEADLEKVVRALLPNADGKSVKTLVLYAQSSMKYLAGIDSAVRRARYLAEKEGRTEPAFADVKRAISDAVIPSDSALAGALQGASRAKRGRGRPPVERPLERLEQVPCKSTAGRLQEGSQQDNLPDLAPDELPAPAINRLAFAQVG